MSSDPIGFEFLLPAFGLVLARTAGLVLGVPMLASEAIPRAAKVWLVVTLALVVFPTTAPLLPKSLTLSQAAAGMVGEFLIGEMLGLAASAVFLAAEVAGKIVSHQSGLALGQVYNPISDTTTSELDQIWFFATLMIFMALRGHIAVVEVLLTSFQQVPPLLMPMDVAMGDFVIGLLRSVFSAATRLAGPAVLALLLSSLVMGVLTKTMPQLNVLSVGFSIKIATAIMMVGVTIAYSENLIGDVLLDGLDQMGLLFEDLSRTLTHGR